MTIIRKPNAKAAEAFINGAPDAGAGQKKAGGFMRGNRRQVALTFPPEVIMLIDEAAKRFGISRAAYVNRAVAIALEADS